MNISQVVEIDGNPVTVTLIGMGYGIEEAVCQVDGHYNIFLNARSSHAAQLNAFNHAIEHIRRDDWEKADVQLIEAEAHHDIASAILGFNTLFYENA